MEHFKYAITSLIDTLKYCTLNTDYMSPYLSESGSYPFRDKIYEKNENKFYDEKSSSEDDEINKLFTPIENKIENLVTPGEVSLPGDSLPYPKVSVEELDKEMDDYWKRKEIYDFKNNNRTILYNLIEDLP